MDCGFVRCGLVDEEGYGRGEYAYKTQRNPMDNPELVGLVTWCRCREGAVIKHSTYGLDDDSAGCLFSRPVPQREPTSCLEVVYSQDSVIRSQGFWDSSKTSGDSKYLKLKGVGSYGIRFIENQSGFTVVVPARNSAGSLKAVQFLNPDGTKRFPKGSSVVGLFHALAKVKNGVDIGIAESYVTAATCYELSGISTLCAFSSGNLAAVAKIVRDKYPDSRIVVFADNDRHNDDNPGVKFAQRAVSVVGANSALAVPCFGAILPAKDASDWNDLIKHRGMDEACTQIKKFSQNR